MTRSQSLYLKWRPTQFDGVVGQQHVVQAHAWWRLSSDKGHTKAREFVELIESIMTPEERTRARNLAADLRGTATAR